MKKYNDRSVKVQDWTVAKLIKTYTESFKALQKGFEIYGFSLEGYNRDLMTRAETELNRRGYTVTKEFPELMLLLEN